MTENMKRKKASAAGFRPAHQHTSNSQEGTEHWTSEQEGAATDHEVGDAAEHQAREGPQREDVRQDLAQEVDRDAVVAADVLVTDGTQRYKTKTQGEKKKDLKF